MSTRSIPSTWRGQSGRYRLIGSRVPGEKKIYFPPRSICPYTYKEATEEVILSGKGKIIKTSIVHVPPERKELSHPYIMAIVELEEGPKVTAEIVGIDLGQVEIGMDVKATFRKYGADKEDSVIVYGYKFTPVFLQK